VMKRYIIIMSFLIAWAASLTAANITQEQAYNIVRNYVPAGSTLYVNVNAPNPGGIVITTSEGEIINVEYACWVYCLNESDPVQRRYFFVKEEDGSLVEVIASNDISALGNSWMEANPCTDAVIPLNVTVSPTGVVILTSEVSAGLTGVTGKGFEYRLEGTSTWTVVPVTGSFEFNASELPVGTYETRAFVKTSTGCGTLYSITSRVMAVCGCLLK